MMNYRLGNYTFLAPFILTLTLVATTMAQDGQQTCPIRPLSVVLNLVLSLESLDFSEEKGDRFVQLSDENLPTEFCLSPDLKVNKRVRIFDHNEKPRVGSVYYKFDSVVGPRTGMWVTLNRYQIMPTGFSYSGTKYLCHTKNGRWRCTVRGFKFGQS
jgi:hypothetical protein